LTNATLEKRPLPPETAAALRRSWTEAEAYAYCSRLTHGHYENFPVGSALIPQSLRRPSKPLRLYANGGRFSDEKPPSGDEQERLAYVNVGRHADGLRTRTAAHPDFIALRATLDRIPLPVQMAP